MKKKLLIINIINISSIILAIVIGLIIGFVNKEIVFFYKDLCVTFAVTGIINFLFLLIKEAKLLEYDSKKFTPILFVVHTFLGVALYYLALFVDFSKFAILLWTLLAVAILLPIILFIVLNYFSKKKKKNNKPRFIVNK